MTSFPLRAPLLFLVALVTVVIGRATEPANLGVLKNAVRAYVQSGEYERDIAKVTTEADAWLQARARQGGKNLTVLFDVDETLLSNLPEMESIDFGYVPQIWTAWIAKAEAPGLTPACELLRTARRLGYRVIILSGRRERDRPGTEKNLKAVGCGDYDRLILKADDVRVTTGAWKTEQRRKLVAEGCVIVANIGDQESDFAGGMAEKDFKLPSPFYLMK
ncbi:MAG: HAD family acid phosphatase [Verrucomicrobia bacterium]|nr:HAD family acid phosphatase [Verrucomicrobiota bacterium]